MNAFYICCIADPFLDCAKVLESQYGITPVYWIGDRESAKEGTENGEIVKNFFPNIVFQKYYDAYRGVFSEKIEKIAQSMIADISLLQQYSLDELQALSMMDRLDYDQHSFTYMERERYYMSLLKKWMACFELYKPDIIISAVNPHRVFDYVLYILCQYKGIPFISFQWTIEAGRIMPVINFAEKNSISKIIDPKYDKVEKNDNSLEQLPEDIRNAFKKLKGDYSVARPKYMSSHDKDDALNKNMFFLIRRFLRTHKLFGKHSMFVEGQNKTVYKNAKYSIEKSRFSLWEWFIKRRKTLKHNKQMQDYYNSLCSEVNLTIPYIAFFLHYQPEETTSPNGGMFANQYLCVEALLKNTPSNVMIYVKEHPNQFMSHMMGHTKRIKEFYDDLVANPRVKLVPFSMDSFSLISNALAVSTVTGTVGWEAAVRQKPVIIFGLIWYECMKGILKVTDDVSASKIYDFITHYKYDEPAIIRYLSVISKETIRAYHYQGYRQLTGISKEESVDNICNSLVSLMKLEKK